MEETPLEAIPTFTPQRRQAKKWPAYLILAIVIIFLLFLGYKAVSSHKSPAPVPTPTPIVAAPSATPTPTLILRLLQPRGQHQPLIRSIKIRVWTEASYQSLCKTAAEQPA